MERKLKLKIAICAFVVAVIASATPLWVAAAMAVFGVVGMAVIVLRADSLSEGLRKLHLVRESSSD